MENKVIEIFIPGPAGRLEAKYYKSTKATSPRALILHPHPQYGGTMNNKIVVELFQTFMENNFSVCRFNFRGVGKSDGEFDNGQGELADAAAALDWLEKENFENSQFDATLLLCEVDNPSRFGIANVKDEKILDFGYQCKSCVYCQASVSLLSRNVMNKSIINLKSLLNIVEKFSFEENIVYQAYELFQKKYGNFGARVNLVKNIPIDSGLGGGSSNAANFLKGICDLWGIELDGKWLYETGEKLGSDVNLFFTPGINLLTGTGSKSEKIDVTIDGSVLIFHNNKQ